MLACLLSFFLCESGLFTLLFSSLTMRLFSRWAGIALRLLCHLGPITAAAVPRHMNYTGGDTGIIAPKVFIVSMVRERKSCRKVVNQALT